MKFILFYSALAAIITTVTAQTNVQDRESRITPVVQSIAKVLPSVVNLSTVKTVEFGNNGNSNENPALEEIQLGQDKAYSLGSGSIIDASGLIVTSAHVVHRAVKINVTLHDGRNIVAELLAVDDLNDIAMLKINVAEKLHPIPMATPGDLLLGETVIVVGNPYGLGNTITQGVLSAIGRKVTHNNKLLFADLLQTDAAVYPGSSGGPLINITGAMIGLNSAMLKEEKSISFAIPLQRIENILAGWLIPERFDNVSLGIIPAVQRLEDGKLLFYIREVFNDSPAWNAGIRAGMLIKDFNGTPVTDLIDLSRILYKINAGEKCVINSIDEKCFRFKTEKLAITDGKKLAEIKLGLKVQPLTAEIADALHYPFIGGAVISAPLDNGSNRLERGEILLRLGDVAINNMNDISKALQGKRFGETIPAMAVSVNNYADRFYLRKKVLELRVQ
jgi:serine protease Do